MSDAREATIGMSDASGATTGAGDARPSARRLGSQLWVDRHHGPERIEQIVSAAARCGIGLLRIFVVWPWVEPEPGLWDFDLYDAVFDAAERHRIGIKATLQPENPPWHHGTPGLVQAGPRHLPFTDEEWDAAEAYLHATVERYRDHPALAQWILWNEPVNYARRPAQGSRPHSTAERRLWHEQLADEYVGDLAVLNRDWNTGYKDFDDVPFADAVVHPDHAGSVFAAFEPWLADSRLRAAGLTRQLRRVHDTIRVLDPRTPTCVNPADLFANHAASGFDLAALATTADVLGSSVHAPWHLGFAREGLHPALTATTIGMLARISGRVELTETQSGPVQYGSPFPRSITPGRLAQSYLAALLAGAESVTGWCLNPRESGFEAGDWALLDDAGRPGARGAAVRRVGIALDGLEQRIGPWQPAVPSVWTLVDEASQAVQLVHSWTGADRAGRSPDDAVQGAAALAAVALTSGVAASVAPVSALDGEQRPSLVFASHLTALSPATARTLLRRAEHGATVVLDGTTGHKDIQAHLHRSWPIGLSEAAGLRVVDRQVSPDGHDLLLFGSPCGRTPLVRAVAEFDEQWTPLAGLTLGDLPAAWTRSWGAGRLVWFAGALGPALVHDPHTEPAVRALLDELLEPGADRAQPVGGDTVTLRVDGERGDAIGILGPDLGARAGQDLCVLLPAGTWYDVWSDQEIVARSAEPVRISDPDGIAIFSRGR